MISKIVTWMAVVFAAAILFSLYGRYPSRPFKGEILKIQLSYMVAKEIENIEITNKSEIADFDEMCGMVWTRIIDVRSFEGSPSWWFEIEYIDGRVRGIYLDDDEFSAGGKPPEELYEYLKINYR